MNIKNNTRFFYRLFILIAVIAFFDLAIGRILQYYYFKQRSGVLYRTTYAMEKTNSDVLVFGASRANHHYYSPAFEKALNMSFYNTGRDGNLILYNLAVLKSTLKRYNPKLVILDMDVSLFREFPANYDRLASLLPYYSSHQEIRDIVNLKGPYEKLKLVSSIYPYNSLVFTIASGNMQSNEKRKADLNGYVALNTQYDGKIGRQNMRQKIDERLVDYFRTFLAEARQAGCTVIVVVSPVFYLYENSASLTIARDICEKDHVTFWDFSKDPYYLNNASFFADKVHLNDQGARVFSDTLAKRIKTCIYAKN